MERATHRINRIRHIPGATLINSRAERLNRNESD